MKRYNRGVSPQGNGNCDAGSEAGMSYGFMHRAHRASTEGRKMGGSVGVWGTPCSIQRGLARRLCILLCTDPLSALAPKLQYSSAVFSAKQLDRTRGLLSEYAATMRALPPRFFLSYVQALASYASHYGAVRHIAGQFKVHICFPRSRSYSDIP
jgi:hypothetical protein